MMASGGSSGFGKLRGLLGGKQSAVVRSEPQSGASPMPSGSVMRQAMLLLQDYESSGRGWFWSTNSEGKLTYISEPIARLIGKPISDLLGLPLHALLVLERDEDDEIERTLPLILSAHKTFSELPVRAATTDQEIWWAVSGRPQFNSDGSFAGYRGNGTDITATRQSHKDASRLAMYDSLTGLSNRHRMNKRLTATLTAFQVAKRSCALLMLDLDRFKQVNDTLGHPAGDELLKQVSQRLRRTLDKNTEIGRLGGDEFQIILPDVDDRGRLGDIAKKIIEMISQPYTVNGSRCIIGASVGVAIAPYDGFTAEDLVRGADLALYAAKGGGRGQFRFYSNELHAEAEKRRRIEEDLRDALVREELRVEYQPQVEIASNRVVGLEAVLRWSHPELGEISPGVFIPIAEETNLIVPIGEWVLRKACSDVAQLPGNVRIAVNVSNVQFSNPEFQTTVTQALANSGLDPERLELELTESLFLNQDETSQRLFTSLKTLGVRFALDDFGTGYSALGYLCNTNFDKLKIDRSFVHGVTQAESRNGAVIKAIVTLASELGMDTTAEGVEALDELEMIRSIGVSQVQGFVYSGSVTFDDASEAMASGEWILHPSGPSRFRADRKTVFLRVALIHEDYRYDVMMRNISRTGCRIEGLVNVPLGTQFVVDFGEGQLAVSTVRRSMDLLCGLEFETPLVDDGAGGLCTRHRVSPYMIAAAGSRPAGEKATPKFVLAASIAR